MMAFSMFSAAKLQHLYALFIPLILFEGALTTDHPSVPTLTRFQQSLNTSNTNTNVSFETNSEVETYPATRYDSCKASWISYMREEWAHRSIRATEKGLLTTEIRTSIFESIERIGISETSQEPCDGIARVKFPSSNDALTTKLVTVIKTYQLPLLSEQFQISQVRNSTMLPPPNCVLDRYNCMLISIGVFLEKFSIVKQDIAKLWVPEACRQFEIVKGNENPYIPNEGNRQDGWSCELITDQEVVLIYWPPNVTSRDICASNGAGTAVTLPQPTYSNKTYFTTTAISFAGKDLYLQHVILDNKTTTYTKIEIKPSVMYGNWTFWSPTVYLAHHPITRMDQFFYMSQNISEPFTKGSIIYSPGVFPLLPQHVYTVAPLRPDVAVLNGVEYARKAAKGEYDPLHSAESFISTAFPLNYDHLREPVPASLYYNARTSDCWGKQSHCSRITDGSFRPLLSLHPDVWESLAAINLGGPLSMELYPCQLPLLVDPPLVLNPIPESEIKHEPVISHMPRLSQEARTTPASPNPQFASGRDRGGNERSDAGSYDSNGRSQRPWPGHWAGPQMPVATGVAGIPLAGGSVGSADGGEDVGSVGSGGGGFLNFWSGLRGGRSGAGGTRKDGFVNLALDSSDSSWATDGRDGWRVDSKDGSRSNLKSRPKGVGGDGLSAPSTENPRNGLRGQSSEEDWADSTTDSEADLRGDSSSESGSGGNQPGRDGNQDDRAGTRANSVRKKSIAAELISYSVLGILGIVVVILSIGPIF